MTALGSSTDGSNNALLSELAQLRRERATQRKSERKIALLSGDTVCIEQQVGASMGGQVGIGAICMCDYLQSLVGNPNCEVAPTSRLAHVLELGSGTGAVGIVCAALFPECQIVISDRESQRDLIVANMTGNRIDPAAGRVRFEAVDWTDQDVISALLATAPRGGFTHVLMSDVLSSDRAQFEPLVRALSRLTSPGSLVLFSHASSAEEAAHPQLALLARSTERKATPLQDFLKLIEVQFNVTNVSRNRLWLFTRRSGAWLTTDGAFSNTLTSTTAVAEGES
jgi:predicted O-methyltransferase YrrM